MNVKITDNLLSDYLLLKEKYSNSVNASKFSYFMIKYSVKLLMDTDASYEVAIESINKATGQGIKWHIDELEQNRTKE